MVKRTLTSKILNRSLRNIFGPTISVAGMSAYEAGKGKRLSAFSRSIGSSVLHSTFSPGTIAFGRDVLSASRFSTRPRQIQHKSFVTSITRFEPIKLTPLRQLKLDNRYDDITIIDPIQPGNMKRQSSEKRLETIESKVKVLTDSMNMAARNFNVAQRNIGILNQKIDGANQHITELVKKINERDKKDFERKRAERGAESGFAELSRYEPPIEQNFVTRKELEALLSQRKFDDTKDDGILDKILDNILKSGGKLAAGAGGAALLMRILGKGLTGPAAAGIGSAYGLTQLQKRVEQIPKGVYADPKDQQRKQSEWYVDRATRAILSEFGIQKFESDNFRSAQDIGTRNRKEEATRRVIERFKAQPNILEEFRKQKDSYAADLEAFNELMGKKEFISPRERDNAMRKWKLHRQRMFVGAKGRVREYGYGSQEEINKMLAGTPGYPKRPPPVPTRRPLKENELNFGRQFERMQIEQQKAQFLKFGQLPTGFEFLPGHMGRLGRPAAVAARGVQPLSGGYIPSRGYSGGYVPSGGKSPTPTTTTETTKPLQQSPFTATSRSGPKEYIDAWNKQFGSGKPAGPSWKGPLRANRRGRVDPISYYRAALEKVKNSKLIGFVPQDGPRFGIHQGTASEWARFMTQLTKQESNFNVNVVGDAGRSIGLSQMYYGEYGIKDPRNPDQAQSGMIKQFEKYVIRSGSITGRGRGGPRQGVYGGWKGVAAYFGPLRRTREFFQHNEWMRKMSPEFEKYSVTQPQADKSRFIDPSVYGKKEKTTKAPVTTPSGTTYDPKLLEATKRFNLFNEPPSGATTVNPDGTKRRGPAITILNPPTTRTPTEVRKAPVKPPVDEKISTPFIEKPEASSFKFSQAQYGFNQLDFDRDVNIVKGKELKNYGSRSGRQRPYKFIGIHYTSGPTLSSALETAKSTNFGYQYIIDKDGTVHRVQDPEKGRANHWGGEANVHPEAKNHNSLGISFVGYGGKSTPAQRKAGLALIEQLRERYKIEPENVLGHGEVTYKHRSKSEGYDILIPFRQRHGVKNPNIARRSEAFRIWARQYRGSIGAGEVRAKKQPDTGTILSQMKGIKTTDTGKTELPGIVTAPLQKAPLSFGAIGTQQPISSPTSIVDQQTTLNPDGSKRRGPPITILNPPSDSKEPSVDPAFIKGVQVKIPEPPIQKGPGMPGFDPKQRVEEPKVSPESTPPLIQQERGEVPTKTGTDRTTPLPGEEPKKQTKEQPAAPTPGSDPSTRFNPESERPSQGSSGYGSYGRCFV